MRKDIIESDSFVDDFNCRKMSKSISSTYAKGKADKEAAALKAAQGGKKDEDIGKEAKSKICSWFCEQWFLLTIGAPFMFAGSIIDMAAPGYVGLIMDAVKNEDYDHIRTLVLQFLFIALISGVCAFIRELIFGIVSQKLGLSIRH